MVHDDLNARNVLLTDADDVALCDFVGSSLNGERSLPLCFEARHSCPRDRGGEEIRNEVDDLLAVGSLPFEFY